MVLPCFPLVPNPTTVLSSISANLTHYTISTFAVHFPLFLYIKISRVCLHSTSPSAAACETDTVVFLKALVVKGHISLTKEGSVVSEILGRHMIRFYKSPSSVQDKSYSGNAKTHRCVTDEDIFRKDRLL